jgi:hypothetical protein
LTEGRKPGRRKKKNYRGARSTSSTSSTSSTKDARSGENDSAAPAAEETSKQQQEPDKKEVLDCLHFHVSEASPCSVPLSSFLLPTATSAPLLLLFDKPRDASKLVSQTKGASYFPSLDGDETQQPQQQE